VPTRRANRSIPARARPPKSVPDIRLKRSDRHARPRRVRDGPCSEPRRRCPRRAGCPSRGGMHRAAPRRLRTVSRSNDPVSARVLRGPHKAFLPVRLRPSTGERRGRLRASRTRHARRRARAPGPASGGPRAVPTPAFRHCRRHARIGERPLSKAAAATPARGRSGPRHRCPNGRRDQGKAAACARGYSVGATNWDRAFPDRGRPFWDTGVEGPDRPRAGVAWPAALITDALRSARVATTMAESRCRDGSRGPPDAGPGARAPPPARGDT